MTGSGGRCNKDVRKVPVPGREEVGTSQKWFKPVLPHTPLQIYLPSSGRGTVETTEQGAPTLFSIL